MEELDLFNAYLIKELGKNPFDKYIKTLKFIGKENNILILGSVDKNKIEWIRDTNFLQDTNLYLKKNHGFIVKIISLYEDNYIYNLSDEKNENIIDSNFSPAKSNSMNSNLVKKFTFDSFVQKETNQFAYSLAYNVSEFPGKSYNPLYIYSDVGLGKTHLLNAIGNKILDNNKNMNVRCLTSNEFMNEFSKAIAAKKKNKFITNFESLDVLLIDDIQYITKWGGTREQFFNIFNKLINMEKQIVICSDTHPEEIPNLEERLRTRFVMGNIVDIKPYDIEGRIAILKKKIEDISYKKKRNFYISDEVIFFIAEKVSKNIRELEGALNRLISSASLKFPDKEDNNINIAFAKEAIEPFINLNKKIVTFDTIKEFISNKYNIKKSDLSSKSNRKEISFPRQIAMFLCKKLIKCTLTDIGVNFGGKHHSTVLHSIKKVENIVEKDSEFSRIVENYLEYFK